MDLDLYAQLPHEHACLRHRMAFCAAAIIYQIGSPAVSIEFFPFSVAAWAYFQRAHAAGCSPSGRLALDVVVAYRVRFPAASRERGK